MATFFGGETLIGVQYISGSTSSGTTTVTLYTVPAGTYAKIAVNSFVAGTGTPSISFGSIGYNADVPPNPNLTILGPGQTITYNRDGGTLTWRIIVREYSIP